MRSLFIDRYYFFHQGVCTRVCKGWYWWGCGIVEWITVTDSQIFYGAIEGGVHNTATLWISPRQKKRWLRQNSENNDNHSSANNNNSNYYSNTQDPLGYLWHLVEQLARRYYNTSRLSIQVSDVGQSGVPIVPVAVVASLKSLCELQHLSFHSLALTPPSMDIISQLTSLRVLHLHTIIGGEQEFEKLLSLTQLRMLQLPLGGTHIDPQTFLVLASGLPHLHYLDFWGNDRDERVKEGNLLLKQRKKIK